MVSRPPYSLRSCSPSPLASIIPPLTSVVSVMMRLPPSPNKSYNSPWVGNCWARRLFNHVTQQGHLGPALDQFLQQILEILFFKEYDQDLIESTAGQTVFLLMQARSSNTPSLLEKVLQHSQSLLSQNSNGGTGVGGMGGGGGGVDDLKHQQQLRHAILELLWNKVHPLLVLSPVERMLKDSRDTFKRSLLDSLMVVRGIVRVK